MTRVAFLAFLTCVGLCQAQPELESLEGEGVWTDPRFEQIHAPLQFQVVVWFEDQFLGDGAAFLRRSSEFESVGRSEMRDQVVALLKAAQVSSQVKAKGALDALAEAGTISELSYFWIVNGFSCVTNAEGVQALKAIPGAKKIFLAGPARRSVARPQTTKIAEEATGNEDGEAFDPEKFDPLWYIEKLQVDQVWKELGITGKKTLNVIHDGNFISSPWVDGSVFSNPAEQLNGKDDDANGLVDDIHGYDFSRSSGNLTIQDLPQGRAVPQLLHGHQCVAIICGRGSEGYPVQPGLAPDSKWAGVIAGANIEEAVQWAIEQGADTYSMSFSRPNLGDYRSHWRKVMEHGAFCGVHFVSGAGNFAQSQPIPVQMRVPEDIPYAVFAAAGVQRDLSRTPFSSQGPVEWKTEHYQDGRVDKPEVCAFNFRIPLLLPEGGVPKAAANGNSFAGPMFCGTIALMLSANPELKPWETREIIIQTATDIGEKGFDFQTGHGLINALEAVRAAAAKK